MTDEQVQEFLVIFAVAAIVGVCFAMSIGLVVYGVFTWFSRQGKGDVVAAIFSTICGFLFLGLGGWAFWLFRNMFLRLSGL